jgi:PhnB protein
MEIQAYLFFEGHCEEAIKFYQQALSAELVMLMHYRDSPEPPSPECADQISEDKIMHAMLRIGGSLLMVSDGLCSGKPVFAGFRLHLTAATPAEAEQKFNALAEGGEINMPLGKTFWSPSFGMLNDRFGVGWMVGVMEPV